MKRRLVSVFITIMMLVIMIYPAFTVSYAWNGSSKNVPSLSGGVYQIATAEELAWFSDAVNSGSTSIKGKLTADIYLNDSGSHANKWTPIGNETNAFIGTFDGNGFTIHGMYIDSTDNYVGFFGNVFVAAPEATEESDPSLDIDTVAMVIKNLAFVDSYVTGKQNVGGIVGYGSRVGIENCSYSGTVQGTYNSVGGIIGFANATSVISECHSSGSVTGTQRTGGIVGFASSNTFIRKCYSDIDVTGTINVGGIVGTLTGSYLNGCFFLGSVNATDRAGGLVGYSAFGTMDGAYAIAPVNSTGSDIGGIVGVTYDGVYNALYYSYETSNCEDSKGAGRTLAEMKTSSFVKELNSSSVYFCYDYTNINNNYPVLTWMLQTDVWLGEKKEPVKDANGVYLIYKPSELAWFAALVNGTLSGMAANPAASATVMSDLLMNISVYDDTFGIIEWTPIGTPSSPYTGTFNGGGYNIAGIYTTSKSGVNGNYTGLFGYVGAGTIRNTVVIDGLIAGIENVGGIAGYVSGGTINNCCCNSEVQGDKAVGGIVGNLASSASNVTECCMLGSLNGSNFTDDKSYLQNVGGIVGYNNRANISRCFTYGRVNAPLARYVGGIVGNNSGGKVLNSYNASLVCGGASVGGIAGNNNNGTFTYCYSMAKISSTSPSSGMAFGATSGANVSNCYFDNSYATMANTIVGATGLSSDSMTGSAALANMNFPSTEWKATAQDDYYYYYPQLISTSASSVKPIKNASLESVKRVQSKFVVRVEIDGRLDTYYESIEEALNYVKGITTNVLPVIYLVRDVELSSTLNIDTNVGLFGDDGVSIIRASSFTGPMINVTSSLSLGSVKYAQVGVDSFYVDGNSVAGTDSGIVVQNGATLNVGDGVNITGFNTVKNTSNPIKGSAIKVVSGTLNINGGTFNFNVSKSVGGVVYSNEGTVNISGGNFANNESTQGAVVYNENGTATLSGGTFTGNIANQNGGVASTYGVYAKTIVTGEASISGNKATTGGALSAQNYGTVEISGGTLRENTAYSTGGALQIEAGSEAIITGGVIIDNNAEGGKGNAIYNNGTLTLKEAAQIDSNNDVYLPDGKTITVADRLTCSGYAATITPQNYEEGKKVLDGDSMSMFFGKFGISDNTWHTIANGVITCMETTTVAVLSKSGAYSVEYISLAEAFKAVSAGETAIITVVADSTISETIEVNGDVTLLCDDETFTATRSGSFHGVLFNVNKNSILRIGESVLNPTQQAQADYAAGTDHDGNFVVDGGHEATGVVGVAAINVASGGELYLYDGAVIQNFSNTTTGTVTVSGKMHMYGGIIRNNAASYGGGVYVKAAGILNTYGGVISDNTADNGGAAVYSLGTVNRNIHTYNYMYLETVYDEEGNATGYGDPVLKASSKSDILIKDGEEVYLNSNVINLVQTSSDIFITSLSQISDTSEFKINTMTLDFAEYTIGSVVLIGNNLIDYYSYFVPYREGYYIQYNGVLGINKLIVKATSGLDVNRNKALVSGLDLDCLTVGETAILFENDKTLLRFYNISGTKLKNSSAITTGCYVQLIDANNNVIDTLTIVIYGDVNCDGNIDAEDSTLINAYVAGMLNVSNTSVAQVEAADVNRDNSITAIDADHTNQSGLLLQTVSQS